MRASVLRPQSQFFAALHAIALRLPMPVAARSPHRPAAKAAPQFKPTRAQPYDSHRQRERYARNRMDEQQRASHKPGTVQPRHIFGAPA